MLDEGGNGEVTETDHDDTIMERGVENAYDVGGLAERTRSVQVVAFP